MTFGELKRLLRKNGCHKFRDGKKHEVWFSPRTGKYFSVGRHDKEEVKTGTYHSIKKDAGI